MNKIVILVFFSIVSCCLGSGESADGTDELKIMKVPRTLVLECNTTSNEGPDFKVSWSKDGVTLESNDRVTAKVTGMLTISPSEEDDIGDYICASRDGSYTKRITVIIITYKKLPKSTTAIEGDKFTLTCEVQGLPVPVISWFKGNESLDVAIGSERLEFQTLDKYPPNNTVIISNVQREDRGAYMCLFSNHEGLSFNSTSFVRVKDIYAALWPFLGIVAEVVILCFVIFVYEKRRSKNDFEESDTDQGGSM